VTKYWLRLQLLLVASTTNVKHYQHMSKNHQSAREILQLERYFPYRLSILSNRISALISETYSAKFALSITEWRIMAVLGEYPGISADEVSLKTQIEKSILSRAISKLLQRKLLERSFDPADKRRSMLRLTHTGIAVYDELVPMSYDYEQALLTCFSDTERDQFSEFIDRLYQHADKGAS
jgi:DNA-binding MarR family transcriptional regulator